MTDARPLFRPRLLAALVAVVAVSFGVCFAVFVVGGGEHPSAGPDVDSVSALGHRPLVRLLESLGLPVVVGRSRPVARAGPDALVLVLEPRRASEGFALGDHDPTAALAARRAPVLLALPKRRPAEVDDDGRWLASDALVPLPEVERLVHDLHRGVAVRRTTSGFPSAHLGDVGVAPSIDGPVQLLGRHDDLEELVASADGVLLGRLLPEGEDDPAPPLYVLSDPDVLAAHGLHRGANAELVVGWVERLRPAGGTLVVDAEAQGRGRSPSLLRELTSWPLALPVGLAFVAALAAALCGARRFGVPLAPASPFRSRTRPLVEHAADLLEHGGHAAHALSRYAAVALHQAARDVHAPPGLSADATRAWVDHAAAARGAHVTVADLEAVVARSEADPRPGAALDAARRVHAWRRSLTHGHPSRP